MHYTEKVYKPIPEANTILLQVTDGCSHNKCKFCTLYRDVKFSVESIEQIEEDVKEIRRHIPDTKRILSLLSDSALIF